MEVIGNSQNFNELINDDIVLVDFFATWCGPCKMLSPVLEELANDRSELKIVKVDVDADSDLARQYGFMSVPTLMLFKKGNLMASQSGYIPKETLTKWIEANK